MQDDKDKQGLFNNLKLEAYMLLTAMAETKFQSISDIHQWLDNIIDLAEKSNDYTRAMAANAIMLAIGKQLDSNKCDFTCLDNDTQNELLAMLGMP